jgi:hypothetical protein
MRRRIALALLVVTAAALTSGCSGQEAVEARQLLARSDTAFAQVRSATFTARVWTSGAPQDLSLSMSGGGYAKGRHEGDFYVVMTSDDVTLFHDVVVVQRNGKLSGSVDGAVASRFPDQRSDESAVAYDDFSPYVKDVRVEHGRLIDGESMAKIAGSIDTKGLVDGSLGSLTELAALGEDGFDVANVFGDTRFVLYLSEATHLPMRMLVDIPIKLLGEKIVLHMDFAYTSFNSRLRFPSLT